MWPFAESLFCLPALSHCHQCAGCTVPPQETPGTPTALTEGVWCFWQLWSGCLWTSATEQENRKRNRCFQKESWSILSNRLSWMQKMSSITYLKHKKPHIGHFWLWLIQISWASSCFCWSARWLKQYLCPLLHEDSCLYIFSSLNVANVTV